jgi:hypothetical protein
MNDHLTRRTIMHAGPSETRILSDQEVEQREAAEAATSKPTAHHSPPTTHHSPPTAQHSPVRNRIKCHRKVRAGDLVPHEWNFRSHPGVQKAALHSLYEEVGFARSLVAFELPDGRLKLIDGHLRRDLDPDMLVDVEILDVTEEEARKLLLTMDPLAALAQTQEQIHERLKEITPIGDAELKALWEGQIENLLAPHPPEGIKEIDEQFLILVTCRDEKEQVKLLGRFQGEGLDCKALIA